MTEPRAITSNSPFLSATMPASTVQALPLESLACGRETRVESTPCLEASPALVAHHNDQSQPATAFFDNTLRFERWPVQHGHAKLRSSLDSPFSPILAARMFRMLQSWTPACHAGWVIGSSS